MGLLPSCGDGGERWGVFGLVLGQPRTALRAEFKREVDRGQSPTPARAVPATTIKVVTRVPAAAESRRPEAGNTRRKAIPLNFLRHSNIRSSKQRQDDDAQAQRHLQGVRGGQLLQTEHSRGGKLHSQKHKEHHLVQCSSGSVGSVSAV